MNHVYNEKRNRFEPDSDLCCFCKKEDARSIVDAHHLKLYGVVDRTNIIVYKSVKYKTTSVAFPRCPSCRALQAKIDKIGLFPNTLIPLVTYGVSIYTWGTMGIIYGMISSFVLFLISYLFVGDILAKIYKIETISAVQNCNSTAKTLMKAGWRADKPAA